MPYNIAAGKLGGEIQRALGFPKPCEKIVLEIDCTKPIRVYYKGLVQTEDLDKIAAAIGNTVQYIPVADVTVDDDSTVRPTFHVGAI